MNVHRVHRGSRALQVVVECPSIPGCISQGVTESEALANIREAIAGCLEARRANNMPLTIAVHEIEVGV